MVMGKEDISSVPGAEYYIPGQKIVRLSFLKVSHSDGNGIITDPEIYKKVVRSFRETDPKKQEEDAVASAPWFKDLIKDVKAGKKTALIEAGAGVLMFFVAVGAGYEFGVRKGIDLREWINNMNEKIKDAKKEKK